ncbi:family 10 glycosylhydrolase [Tellurirhabdus rosea]|uniref:family 10 glycosylhydrolase n=1 Tax=Tellurirhabdus rosea TaxID=2674997 RepID=UPI0022592220|nr:family 10 glycosylhydrolase [Tellurirhabdus rosea]
MNYLFLALIFISTLAFAQPSPKREFRAAWVATVGNIDWPSSKTLTPEQQRAEFVNILNQHKQAGLNAVIVQVRSVADAIYPSPFEPWAEVLTGRQGRAPQPQYDPLQFMIGECRKRGLEFHAWFNPYRAVSNIQTATLDPNHVVVKHPDWLLAQGNLRILNPGLPEVRAYVTGVVMDVVRRYDIDGVHFDDYFYPYPETGKAFNDDSTYALYPRGIAGRADWRRDNVDLFVKMVSDSIRAAKPWVKFGISPFGIWQNKSASQPLGSDSRGLESYSAIYADSRKWFGQNWVDYIAPQLYWHIGNAAADFAKLLPWWSALNPGRHLYIGHGLYRVNNDADAAWKNPAQIPNQMRLLRQTANVQGSIFYNTNSLNKNPLGVRDSLRTTLYNRPALLPPMPWKDATPPPAPLNLIATVRNNTAELHWNRPQAETGELGKIRQYAIYRAENGQPDLGTILALTATDTLDFADTGLKPGVSYTYVVTALDRLHNESPPSNALATAIVTGVPAAEIARTELLPVVPNPFRTSTRITYRLAEAGPVTLAVYDALGRMAGTLVQETQPAGEYSVYFDAGTLPDGVYIATLVTEKHRLMQRIILQR